MRAMMLMPKKIPLMFLEFQMHLFPLLSSTLLIVSVITRMSLYTVSRIMLSIEENIQTVQTAAFKIFELSKLSFVTLCVSSAVSVA